MSDYTQSFYIEKDKNGKEVTRLDFSYLIALILIAAAGFLIALQLNGFFESINNSLIEGLKKHTKNIFKWSWLIKLIIVIIGISLSIFLIWASFELFIKNNERARSQIHLHEKEEEVEKK
tara:strand:+ start:641 stop:1000 length:360 start_codon:yes stop_codon:yes gene_type:complete